MSKRSKCLINQHALAMLTSKAEVYEKECETEEGILLDMDICSS